MSVQVEAPPRYDKNLLRRQRTKMSIKRKRITPPSSQQQKNLQANGLYVHSSPPRVLQVNPSIIRQWLRSGDLEKLESVVLEGQGHKLVGEYSPDPKVRAYLKTVPALMAKMEMLHEAVTKGNLSDMETLLQEEKSKKMAVCKDPAGVPLLQKAVYYGHLDIVTWLVEFYPPSVNAKDRLGADEMIRELVVACRGKTVLCYNCECRGALLLAADKSPIVLLGIISSAPICTFNFCNQSSIEIRDRPDPRFL